MQIRTEIKEFIKNTLILTLFFTIVFHLSWGYIRPYLYLGASAGNDAKYIQRDMNYLGNIATATSLFIGQSRKASDKAGNILADEIISIAEVLSHPKDGSEKLIGSHMLGLQSYINLLQIDIPNMLDQSVDRTIALDEHIELLKSTYTTTAERLALIGEQITYLKTIQSSALGTINDTKGKMEEKYKAYEYIGIDPIIDDYIRAKTEESRARVYLAYLERFQKGYAILQGQNKKLLDTLINNREALIKRSFVVIPDTGPELLKKLNLLQTEKSYKESLK